jgi:MFS transporter, DHA1 family, inner membrane transport protein
MRRPGILSDHKALITSLLVLTVTRLIINMTRRFAYPFAPAIGRQLDVPLTSVQCVMALQSGAGISSPFFGTLSERFGRKRVMLGALTLITLAALFGALLPQFWVFAWVMITLGAGNMIFLPTMQAYLGDRVPYRRRALAIGTTELSWAGSLVIIAPLAGFLLETSGLQLVFAVMAAACFGALLLVWSFIPPDPPATTNLPRATNPLLAFRILSRSRAGLGAVGFTLLHTMANEIFFINYGVFMELSFALVLASLGAATTVIAAAEVCGEFVVIGLADRFGKRRLALLGVAVSSISYLILPLLTFHLGAGLAGLFVMFFCVEMAIVSSISLFTEIMPDARAVMMSGNVGASALGRVTGAGLGGLLYALTGNFIIIGVITMGIGLLAVFMMWRFVQEGEQEGGDD